MICLRCGHVTHPDREMDRVQRSTACACPCHPWVKAHGRDPVMLVWTTGSPWTHAADPQGQEVTICQIRFFHGTQRRQGDWDEVTCPRCRMIDPERRPV